jgi:O-antigen/teichoic acid export membrane protein
MVSALRQPGEARSLKQIWVALRKDFLFRNSVYFFTNTVSLSALGFMFWWVSARLYSAEQVGGAVVMIAIAQLTTTVSNLGLSFGLIRFLPDAQNKPELINFALSFVGGMTLILIAGIILPGVVFLDIPTGAILTPASSIVLVFLVVSLAIYQLSSPIFAAFRAGQLLLGVNLVTAIGRLAFVLLFANYPSAETLFISFGLPTLIAAVVIIWFILPKLVAGYHPRIALGFKRFAYLVRYSLPNYAGNVFHDAPYQLLPQIVAAQVGVASAAYFYIVWNFFNLITTIGGATSLSLFVEGSHNARNLPGLARKALGSTVGITLIVAIAVMFFSRPILLLFGVDYAAEGAILLRLVSLAAIPAVVVYNKVATLRVAMRLRKIVAAFALIAAISLTLSLTPLGKDVVAIGFIWLIAQMVTAVYLVVVK